MKRKTLWQRAAEWARKAEHCGTTRHLAARAYYQGLKAGRADAKKGKKR